MSDNTRVHPMSLESATEKDEKLVPNPEPSSKPVSSPATYVVQFPREQILRYPPPENAAKFENLTRRGKNNRSCFRRCCCYTLLILALLVVAAGVSAGILYAVFRFKAPNYAVTHFSIANLNVTSAAPISPGFNVTVRAVNPNGKVGIRYMQNSDVSVFYNDVRLGNGVLPAFYQGTRNTTEIVTSLRGNDVVLGGNVRTSLRNAVRRSRVPFVVRVRAPVRVRVGAVSTWTINVGVRCDVVVDGLNSTSRVISNDCDYRVRLW